MEPAISLVTQQIMVVQAIHQTILFIFDASPLSYCSGTRVNSLLGPLIATYVPREECFFQFPGQNMSNDITVQLVFKNNCADNAGSVLYGGAIENCKLIGLDSCSSSQVFDMLFYNNDTDYNATSNISSDPFQVCPCTNDLLDCDKYFMPRMYVAAYPGETFQVSVVTVGQRDGTVPSTVRSTIKNTQLEVDLLESQYLQQVSNTCTKLTYNVFSLSQSVNIQLQTESYPCSKFYYTYMHARL